MLKGPKALRLKDEQMLDNVLVDKNEDCVRYGPKRRLFFQLDIEKVSDKSCETNWSKVLHIVVTQICLSHLMLVRCV